MKTSITPLETVANPAPARPQTPAIQPQDGGTPSVTGWHIGHRFADGPWLFRNLDFTLTTGEAVGLCGPSGSGKSTLLSVIAGFETPAEGTIRRSRIDRVRWVFQNPTACRAAPPSTTSSNPCSAKASAAHRPKTRPSPS